MSSVTGVGVNFLPWKKRQACICKALCDDQLLVLLFLANFHVYVERNDIRIIDISASESQNCLLHLLSLVFRVLSFPRRAAIDREPWFTGTIEHRFSNSVDQSGGA